MEHPLTTLERVEFVLDTFDRPDWVPVLVEQITIAIEDARRRGRAEAFAEAAQLAERTRLSTRTDGYSRQLALRAAIAVAIRELAQQEPPPR